jgi:hypothetical protein
MPKRATLTEERALDSWKEVAAFLNRGVRTVQRWEKTEGLPVRRHQHLKRGSVCAMPSELADWQRVRQLEGKARFHVRSGELKDQFDLLHSLTARQHALAKELHALLAVNEGIRNQVQLKPLSLPSALLASTNESIT